MKTCVPLACRIALAQVIHGAGDLMREHREGLALTMAAFQAREGVLACKMVASQPHHGVGTGPRAGGLAELLARGAVACASGCLGALDEATRGHACLPAWQALPRVALIEPPARQDRADPGDRAPAVAGVRLVCLSGLDNSQRAVRQPAGVGPTQRASHRDARVDGGSWKALRHAGAVRLVGQLRPELGQVRRAVRLLDMGEERGPGAQARQPAPEQIPGGPQLCGVARGMGAHPAAPEDGDLGRRKLVVCRLAPREGLQVAGVAEDDGHACLGAAVRAPGPR